MISPTTDNIRQRHRYIDELLVQQNGEDIRQKLHHKVLTAGRSHEPSSHEGRLLNILGLDPEHAPLVAEAFELYATGKYSADALEFTMAGLGLTTKSSGRNPQAMPVSSNKLHCMLANPNHAGRVTVDDRLMRGRHGLIITQQLFARVQDVRRQRSAQGNRDRRLEHYLKCMIP